MILASASPRRRELLEAVGLRPEVVPTDVDETRLDSEAPTTYVARLARTKAHAALKACGRLPRGEALLGADTIVHLGNNTFGKPVDDARATAMLRALSGTTHQVSTGVCVIVGRDGGIGETTFVETTDVTFFELTDAEIAAYVASGEPRDKAGGYGVQATGRLLVSRIHGDYYNVVGLPVARVVRTLAELGTGDGSELVTDMLARRGD